MNLHIIFIDIELEMVRHVVTCLCNMDTAWEIFKEQVIDDDDHKQKYSRSPKFVDDRLTY